MRKTKALPKVMGEGKVEQRFLHFWRCHKISLGVVGSSHYAHLFWRDLTMI